MNKEIISQSVKQTNALGQSLGKLCRGGEILCLIGNLGSGKTTFVKGLAEGLKIKADQVHSPTFILMDHHKGKLMLYHFDLYRLEKLEEIERLGYEEFFYSDGVCVIEWADKLGMLMPLEYLEIKLEHAGEDKRKIQFRAVGEKYKAMLGKIK